MNSARWRLLLLLPAVALVPSCVTMKHQLEQDKPLQINVNVRLQVDRELDEFFAFERKYEGGQAPGAGGATQPATEELPPPVTQPTQGRTQ